MNVQDSRESGLSGLGGVADDHKGPGLGLLSRFLGAVFLVLLCGLLLLDRALLQANRDQTILDVQATGLLVERFVAEEATVLDQMGAGVAWTVPSPERRAEGNEILRKRKEAQGFWIADSLGNVLAMGGGDTDAVLSAARGDVKPGTSIVSRNGHAQSLILRREYRDRTGQLSRSVGLLVDPAELQRILDRLVLANRVTLSLTSGPDTIAFVGRTASKRESLTEAKRTVRLPSGGAWTISSTHVLTSRSLRWALWALGIFGLSFLALGLLREQKRALEAAGRSTELEKLYRDVKRANQAKSEFLANVSHELRTPLNAIVGFVELLREGFYGDLSPRQAPPVDRIAASATHLRHLVDQVLDIAKIAAGRLEVHAETIVLRPFVLNIASELESLVSEKQLSFSITVAVSLPRVRTDPSHLRQILINLIGNAVKYTQTGTISIRARLITDSPRLTPTGLAEENPILAPRSGSWIALQVVDTGVGIARGDLERIFDEFEQVNAGPRGDSMSRGTGLGLAISRRLARLLGGEITVTSEIGRGSIFTIWLPVNSADLVRDPVATPSNEENATV